VKLSRQVGLLAALTALAAAGLVAPGWIGQVGAYVWLGVFPGLAAVRLLLPRATAFTRWTLGITLSPLIAALAGWCLSLAGMELQQASRLVGMAGWLLYAGGEARAMAEPRQDEGAAPTDRFLWGWLLACAAFVALPAISSEWIRVRSDTWVHGALVWEILHHGVPPMDPRFIGLQLNYVWFYNLYIAMVTSLRGQDPFVSMVIMNVVDMVALQALLWTVAYTLWQDVRAARGALVLGTLGLNAGMWLLWPLQLVRALNGEVRGLAEVKRILANSHWDSTDVIYQIQAPFAWMVNFWDKYTLGTPLGYAYLFMLVHWWALGRLWQGASRRWLAVTALSAAGMMLFHSVVGLSVIPVSCGAFALALLARRRLPGAPVGRTLAAWGALLVGFAACLPYLASIASGWDAGRSGMQHHYLQPGWRMPWTLLTACLFAAVAAFHALRRHAARRAFAIWLGIWSAGMLAFACIVHLPEGNEHKFVFALFIALALLGGKDFLPALDRLKSRFGGPLVTVAFALVFVLPQALYLRGYLLDPGARTAPALAPAAGEDALYQWMQQHTRTDVVFLDHLSRDLIMVKGQRRLLAGTVFGPDRAAFPVQDLQRRRELMADLYGPVAEPQRDLAVLRSVMAAARDRHPVSEALVLYRRADFAAGDEPWARLERAAGADLERRYDQDGFLVLAVRAR